MTAKLFLNKGWDFSVLNQNEYQLQGKVSIPHTVKEIPFGYFDESSYQMQSLYKKEFQASPDWKDKQVVLTFDGVAQQSVLKINGETVKTHNCGYTAFSANIENLINYEKENIIELYVDSRESLNQPPFGNVVDYLTYGGIYRDVYIEVKNKTAFQDIFLSSDISFFPKENIQLNTKFQISQIQDVKIQQFIEIDSDFKLIFEKELKKNDFDSQNEFSFSTSLEKISNIQLWSVEQPNLYKIKTVILDSETILDQSEILFGFRKAEFKKDGFYLNNKKLKIRGLNRHQAYPYVGYAMPKSMQIEDARILKEELGLNAVRTSHYPQSHYFIEACDKLGLLVFTEFPGWQHIGDAEWKKQAVKNVEDMVNQYKNHPSIILWGVRINESPDDDDFYLETNKAARKIDSTRQTGGVRKDKNSSLLEDVYTYNDFVHNGSNQGCEPKAKVTSNINKPYLISEYNGHMFPTKSYDPEEHRQNHALRHAEVLNAVASHDDISGSFGWCMADYNTHKDFGSGDKICHHGVLDMFRNPKMAAYIYSMQDDKNPVLEISSSMDIGEHPASCRGETWIFTNADSVKMYKNNKFIKEYFPATSTRFSNLKAKPVFIDDFIGSSVIENEKFDEKTAKIITKLLNWFSLYGFEKLPKKAYLLAARLILVNHMNMADMYALYGKYVGDWGGNSTEYKFEAIKDGVVVKSVVKKPMSKLQLETIVSHSVLKEENTYDVASIRILMKDENHNLLSFYNDPVELSVEGPVELIGEKIIGLKGGMGGTYIKSTGKAGKAKLKISAANCPEITLDFEVVC